MADTSGPRKKKLLRRRFGRPRRVAAGEAEARSPPCRPVPEDPALAAHELRVHQIELEMQTKECAAQLELDAQRAKYFELFDLAPVGCTSP